MAGTLTCRLDRRQGRDLEWEAQTAAATLELVANLCEAADVTAGCHCLAGELQFYLSCTRVAIGLRRGRTGSCRLVTISGLADFDLRGEIGRSLEAALDESVLRNETTVWPPADPRERGATLCHQKLASLMAADVLLSAPLRTASGAVIGAWIFLGSEALAELPEIHRFIEACSPAVAASLHLLKKGQEGPLRRVARRAACAAPLLRGRRLWLLLAALVAVLFVPAPYKVSVECEVQPVVRRFVAAPFAGEFDKCLVKPGDLVARGQVLGRMEGRDVRWELAGLTADQQRARKSADANMALGKTAAAQMDQLETQRLELKRKLLENRLAQLGIRSPIDGIVISGDLERSQGVPVAVGQVLFEVAPLQSMLAELAVPDEEISRVEMDMTAAISLDAYPETAWNGAITRIHPRSVTREKDNVFLGEVHLDNTDLTLRPGMKGRAKVSTGNRSLGWILFHKPWQYVVSWLDW
jgi:multidrug resistance efflux pump